MGCRLNEAFSEYEANLGELIRIQSLKKYQPLLDDVETIAEAVTHRERVVSQLIRCDVAEAVELASTLQNCAEDHPCGSGVCPTCDLASRQVLIPAAHDALHPGRPLAKIWLEPRSWRIPIGTLAEVDLARFASSRERVIREALPDVAMFGFAHIKLNGWDRGPGEWQLRINLIAEAADLHQLRETLCKCFPGDPAWQAQHAFTQIPEADRLREMCFLLEPVLNGSVRSYRSQGDSDKLSCKAPANATLEALLSFHRFPIHRRLLLPCLRLMSGRDGFGVVRSG